MSHECCRARLDVRHAAGDIHHHRTGRVVDHSLAEFCAMLDILVAVIALTT